MDIKTHETSDSYLSPVPGGEKTFYAQEVSVEEQDLKAHRQNQKVSHHIGDANFIRIGA